MAVSEPLLYSRAVSRMSDREAKDLARRERKAAAGPTKKSARQNKDSENKENEVQPRKQSDDYLPASKEQANIVQKIAAQSSEAKQQQEEKQDDFDHPIYKEISMKNGLINRSDTSSLKAMCKEAAIDHSGKATLLKQRLKQFHKCRLLREAGLVKEQPYRGFDFYLVVDFEATCEERNPADYPHEIIEFPGVLVDGRTGKQVASWREYVRPVLHPSLSEFCTSLTGISQQTVDGADTFPTVLHRFSLWLDSHGLGTQHTFALVTDGPFDVGRFLRLACEQVEEDIPAWADHWVNVRKGFANFYRTTATRNTVHLRLPGLANMLELLDLEFQGNPHSGLDDAVNIGRVVARMVADGANLKVNERLELSPAPVKTRDGQKPKQLPHVSPVSKTQAELWLNHCRQQLTG